MNDTPEEIVKRKWPDAVCIKNDGISTLHRIWSENSIACEFLGWSQVGESEAWADAASRIEAQKEQG